ncbi:muellerian-inhibiting factor [Diretmus argenteus]
MLVIIVFYCSALMLSWTGECVHQQVTEGDGPHGQKSVPVPDPPGTELLVEKEEGGRLVLTLDLPQSPLLKRSPILLLAFGSPLKARDLGITFTSQCLHPNTQTVCISEETQYILLTGKASEGNVHQKWKLSVETKNPDGGQMLQEILIGGDPGRNISVTPLLLFLLDREMRSIQVPGSSLGPSETFSFLCELQKFLDGLLPQVHPEPTPVQLASVQLASLPPLVLGLSSSDTLLVALLNSSAPMVFSFPSFLSVRQVHRGELALPSALLELLRQRLKQAMMLMREVISEEDVGQTAMERLERLEALTTFPKEEPASGESQYRAFLLVKALQTVTQAYEVERGLRATRADQYGPAGGDACALHSLTVSLKPFVNDPPVANINNCHGTCHFPLTHGINHAILLNAHIDTGKTLRRSLCCVPVAYEDLEVVILDEERATFISIKPDMVATKCACR